MLRSSSQLLSTIAYRIGGRLTYALEGSILSAGATIRWLRDGLGLFTRTEEVEALAASVTDSGGVYLIPAFTGLGAPYWDPEARAAILGLTSDSGRAQIARAALDSVAYQTFDLIDAMARDGLPASLLKIDGGMVRNSLFCQQLADIVGIAVLRPSMTEATAFGAACLAGLGHGEFLTLDEVTALWQPAQRYEPRTDPSAREQAVGAWRTAVERVRSMVHHGDLRA